MINLSDFLVIGDIYILNGENKPEQIVKSDTIKELPKVVRSLTEFKNKIKEEVTEAVKPGVIRRPTAGELLAKDEPEVKKEADSALSDTLDAIPELKKAKEYLAQQKE